MKKAVLLLAAALLLALSVLASGCAAPGQAPPAPAPTEHAHLWQDGECAVCGAVCPHEWRDGTCAICGAPCPHEWREGVCALCGAVCPHEWQDGVCAVCGAVCPHEWQDGVCAICGAPCPHPQHGQEDLLCADCALTAPHSYLNGVCSRCGARPHFFTKLSEIPETLAIAASFHGTTETYHYPLESGEILPGPHGTYLPEERRQRDMVVYTPPGYDPAGRYDVVILSPGAGHNAHYWMERANRLGSTVGRIKGCELLDRLIEQGLIEPAIFVTVEYYLLGQPAEIAVSYGRDLRERVLPFLAAHYATYASVDEKGALIAAPEHFAFVGASFGAMIGWQLLADNTDLFSYWGLLSGAFKHEEEMIDLLDRGVEEDRPIHWLYAGDGREAQGWTPYLHKVEALGESCSCLEMDKNLSFVAVAKTSHNFSAWDIGLINSLQVFFRSRFEPKAG